RKAHPGEQCVDQLLAVCQRLAVLLCAAQGEDFGDEFLELGRVLDNHPHAFLISSSSSSSSVWSETSSSLPPPPASSVEICCVARSCDALMICVAWLTNWSISDIGWVRSMARSLRRLPVGATDAWLMMSPTSWITEYLVRRKVLVV